MQNHGNNADKAENCMLMSRNGSIFVKLVKFHRLFYGKIKKKLFDFPLNLLVFGFINCGKGSFSE